ncbi:Metallophos domain-containing protein [Psidium guajava]|nr:Metallophos domain-containing protein [Psidium guajava]
MSRRNAHGSPVVSGSKQLTASQRRQPRPGLPIAASAKAGVSPAQHQHQQSPAKAAPHRTATSASSDATP